MKNRMNNDGGEEEGILVDLTGLELPIELALTLAMEASITPDEYTSVRLAEMASGTKSSSLIQLGKVKPDNPSKMLDLINTLSFMEFGAKTFNVFGGGDYGPDDYKAVLESWTPNHRDDGKPATIKLRCDSAKSCRAWEAAVVWLATAPDPDNSREIASTEVDENEKTFTFQLTRRGAA